MTPSMSRPAKSLDNAACESFMKTLKQEEIYCNRYADYSELSDHLEEFIDTYYNRLRLHSALDTGHRKSLNRPPPRRLATAEPKRRRP